MANKKFDLKAGYGNLFRNEEKKGNQPDSSGDIKTPDGKLWQIAGWIKQTKDGKKFSSLKIQEPQEKKDDGGKKSEEEDDDLPF